MRTGLRDSKQEVPTKIPKTSTEVYRRKKGNAIDSIGLEPAVKHFPVLIDSQWFEVKKVERREDANRHRKWVMTE